MIYIKATVKGSSVKLPEAIKVSDGSRVIVTILEPTAQIGNSFLSEELEHEDVEFVRGCRGRLANQLQTANEFLGSRGMDGPDKKHRSVVFRDHRLQAVSAQ